MRDMTPIVPEERRLFFSSLSPGHAQKRLAIAVVFGIVIVFVLISVGLLSGVQARPMEAFLPAYATAMFVCDSITAILLFAQFSILRSRAILVIASGYLFTALILVPYVLTFPGMFVAAPEIGGLQSAAWVYVVWHCGFPLFVLGYAIAKDASPDDRTSRSSAPPAAIAWSVASTVGLVSVIALVCIADEPALPHIMLDPLRFSAEWPYLVGAPIALASISAIVVLWSRRRSMLDLWLMVVMFLYLVEVPLSYYPAPSRFSAGWYAVRVFGFLSSSLVLIVLLYEIETLYARLLGAVLGERREREARLMTGDVLAASIAHEVKQPLTAMITSADAGFRFLDRSMPNLDRAKEAFKLIAADGHRAGEVVENIRANFRNDLRTRASLDVNELIQEALALERGDLEKHRILVQAETTRLPEVQGNRVQLQQVLLNLITNAIYAMAAKDGPRVLCVKSESHERDSIMVSVSDTGMGVGPQDVDRIFNPLFTTKSDGMGMGLSICRAIIEAHNGRLWFSPNIPRGAVFQFTLHADVTVPGRA
jgi:signal transduction histidine kinase